MCVCILVFLYVCSSFTVHHNLFCLAFMPSSLSLPLRLRCLLGPCLRLQQAPPLNCGRLTIAIAKAVLLKLLILPQQHQRGTFSAQIEWHTMFLIHYQTLLWHAARCNPEFTTNARPWKGRAMFLTALTPPSFHHDVNKQLEQGSAKHGITKT